MSRDLSELRPAAPEDVPAVERIVRAAYAVYVERIGKPPAPMLDDYARRVADGTVWVLPAGGGLAGLIVLVPDGDSLLLDNVAVDPKHQGGGVGRALIGFAEAEARRLGCAAVRLYTHQTMHENIRLYRRLGYQETGRGADAGYQRVFFRKAVG